MNSIGLFEAPAFCAVAERSEEQEVVRQAMASNAGRCMELRRRSISSTNSPPQKISGVVVADSATGSFSSNCSGPLREKIIEEEGQQLFPPEERLTSSSPTYVESRSGTSASPSASQRQDQQRQTPVNSSTRFSSTSSSASSSLPLGGDFERLTRLELYAMYSALDVDGDSVVSSADLFAFIAANPQSIDAVVGQHVGLISGADQHPYWARIDSTRLGTVPIGNRGLVFECGPANWRQSDQQREKIPEENAVHVVSRSSGPLWWLRHRVATHYRDKKFVDFILSVAFSVLTKDKFAANSDASGGDYSTSVAHPKSAPSLRSYGSPTANVKRDAKTVLHGSSLSATIFMASSAAARKQQKDGRTPTRNKAGGNSKKYDADVEEDDVFDDDERTVMGSGPPPLISFPSFCLLYREVMEMLSAQEHAFMLAMLDVPMLLSVHTFFRFVATFCRMTGRMPVSDASATTDDEKKIAHEKDRIEASLTLLELQKRVPRVPGTSCASCIAWLVAAWEQQRGLLHVPILQRIGESFLRRKAVEQNKQLKHFLRCFRHVWGPQAVGVRAPHMVPQPTSGASIASAPFNPDTLSAPSSKAHNRSQTAVASALRKQAATANLQQLKVRGRLASMRVLVASSSSADLGDRGQASDDDMQHAEEHPEASGSSCPPTTVKAGGLTPPTRSVSPGAYMLDNDDDEEFALEPGTGGKNANSASASDSTTHIVHALAEPEPLSMISSLSADERAKFSKIRFWCLFRACVYSLVTAIVVGLTNLVCQVIFFSSTPSLLDSSVSSSQALFNWLSGSVFLSVQMMASNSTLKTPLGLNSTRRPEGGSESLDLNDVLRYQLVVSAVALVASVVEIVFLYLDNLQVCYSLAKTGGVPLHRYSVGSKDSCSGWGDRVLSVKEGLSTKRIGFIVAVISRCALQISFDTRTVLRIDVANDQQTAASKAAAHFARRFGRFAPTLVVRVLVGRILTKFLAPFVATPLMVLWNFILSRRAVDASASVVLGAISSECLGRQLLALYFPVPPVIVEHNSRAQSQLQTAASSRDGGAVRIAGIHQAHFHVFREMIALVAFYMHFIGDKTVHPSLHVLLAYVAAHVQLPEECLLCFAPESRKPQDQHCRGSNAATSLISLSGNANGDKRLNEADDDGAGSHVASLASASPSNGDGSLTFHSERTSESSSATGCAPGGQLSLTGVGGSSASSFLSIWMSSMCVEMNAVRQELLHSSSVDWAGEYVLNAATPSDAAARSALCSRLCPSLTHRKSWLQCKIQHIMEQMFVGWVRPAALPDEPSSPSHRSGTAEDMSRGPQMRRVNHKQSIGYGNNKGASPFSPQDVELLACTGILCCVLSTTDRSKDLFASCPRHAMFLHQLAASYAAAHPAATARGAGDMGRELARNVQILADRYAEGCALDIGHVLTCLRDSRTGPTTALCRNRN
jgi:hypothetical protein